VTFRRFTAQPARLRAGCTSRDVTFHSGLLHDVLACRCGRSWTRPRPCYQAPDQ